MTGDICTAILALTLVSGEQTRIEFDLKLQVPIYLTQLSVGIHLQCTPDLSDQLIASAELSLNVGNYPQSAVTFCGCLFSDVLCANWLCWVNREGKEGKTTRHFKVTTAVNIMITLLRLMTPFNLVQMYQSFGGIFCLHLQDTLKKVAVFSP